MTGVLRLSNFLGAKRGEFRQEKQDSSFMAELEGCNATPRVQR